MTTVDKELNRMKIDLEHLLDEGFDPSRDTVEDHVGSYRKYAGGPLFVIATFAFKITNAYGKDNFRTILLNTYIGICKQIGVDPKEYESAPPPVVENPPENPIVPNSTPTVPKSKKRHFPRKAKKRKRDSEKEEEPLDDLVDEDIDLKQPRKRRKKSQKKPKEDDEEYVDEADLKLKEKKKKAKEKRKEKRKKKRKKKKKMKKKKKKTYKYWTPEEEAHLRNGIEVYGIGDWGSILRDPNYYFHKKRDSVSLRDKWRNICRKEGLDAKTGKGIVIVPKKKAEKKKNIPKKTEMETVPKKKAKKNGRKEKPKVTRSRLRQRK